jgi:predicted ribosome quality control (RQC) complex YloA/Tae2 family protein
MLLRKYLEGARILQVNQPPHERIFEIHFESYNELGEKSPLVLSIELMGKHSNIILYNCENNIIIGCAHNIGEEKSKERELAGGLRYIYPQQKDKKNLLKTPFQEFYKDFRGEINPEVLNNLYFITCSPLLLIPPERVTSTYKRILLKAHTHHFLPI